MTNKLDKQIREALRAEDAELFDEHSAEPAIHEMIIGVFLGKHKLLVAWVFILTLAFMGFAVFSAIRFFQAEDLTGQLSWASGFFVGLNAMTALKIWFWMEINKNTLTREVKRVELQIARLAKRIEELAAQTDAVMLSAAREPVPCPHG